MSAASEEFKLTPSEIASIHTDAHLLQEQGQRPAKNEWFFIRMLQQARELRERIERQLKRYFDRNPHVDRESQPVRSRRLGKIDAVAIAMQRANVKYNATAPGYRKRTVNIKKLRHQIYMKSLRKLAKV